MSSGEGSAAKSCTPYTGDSKANTARVLLSGCLTHRQAHLHSFIFVQEVYDAFKAFFPDDSELQVKKLLGKAGHELFLQEAKLVKSKGKDETHAVQESRMVNKFDRTVRGKWLTADRIHVVDARAKGAAVYVGFRWKPSSGGQCIHSLYNIQLLVI